MLPLLHFQEKNLKKNFVKYAMAPAVAVAGAACALEQTSGQAAGASSPIQVVEAPVATSKVHILLTRRRK
jgi:hypothetical protein